MLSELRVRDLGVIEDLTLEFSDGMTALTGETGAGKTLVVEALQLVLGGRSSSTMVRAGAGEAFVEARFVDGDREVVVARSVPAEARGRSRAWVDGRMAPVSSLAELTAELAEIHGQHDHESLVRPAAQRAALDTFAGTDVAPVLAARGRLREIARALGDVGGDAATRAREVDVLRFQVDEISAAAIVDPDEDASLRAEEDRLADAAAYRDAAGRALAVLEEEASGVLDALGTAGAALSGRAAFEGVRARVASAAADLGDVAHTLREVVERWEDDPGRLAAVQERRRVLAALRRKYGEDLAAVVAFGEAAAQRLAQLEDAEGIAARLEAEQTQVAEELARAEAHVRGVRTRAAVAFGARVGERLGDLAMGGARVEVHVAEEGTGEPVEMALGANVGEAVLPLAKAASGGELARAMLAIRLVSMGGPLTMVFDEVDAGVGGGAALALGRALREVSRQRQVLVVTHLAQVAAYADHQVSVQKREVDGRTVTAAAAVAGEERVTELSRMLSGHPDSDAARAHARELLGSTIATQRVD